MEINVESAASGGGTPSSSASESTSEKAKSDSTSMSVPPKSVPPIESKSVLRSVGGGVSRPCIGCVEGL